MQPGSTNLVIALNADNYTGDGPVVQKILNYRSVDGKWSGKLNNNFLIKYKV